LVSSILIADQTHFAAEWARDDDESRRKRPKIGSYYLLSQLSVSDRSHDGLKCKSNWSVPK